MHSGNLGATGFVIYGNTGRDLLKFIYYVVKNFGSLRPDGKIKTSMRHITPPPALRIDIHPPPKFE